MSRRYYWDWRLCLINLSLLTFCVVCWLAIFLFGKLMWESCQIKNLPTVECHKIVLKAEKTKEQIYLEKVFSKYEKAHPEQYAKWVIRYSQQYRVPPRILAGIILQESSGNSKAHNRKDPYGGSRGLTQVCWKWWGNMLKKEGIAKRPEDLFHPQVSIQAGARVLKAILDQHDGNLEKALIHYSGGSSVYFARVQARVSL